MLKTKRLLTKEDLCFLAICCENRFFDEFSPIVTKDPKSPTFHFQMPPFEQDDQRSFDQMKSSATAPVWVTKCRNRSVLCRKVMEVSTIYDDLVERGVFELFYKQYRQTTCPIEAARQRLLIAFAQGIPIKSTPGTEEHNLFKAVSRQIENERSGNQAEWLNIHNFFFECGFNF